MWVTIVDRLLSQDCNHSTEQEMGAGGTGANFDCALHNVNCISSQLTGPLMWHVIELKYNAKPKGGRIVVKIIPGNIQVHI